MSAKDMAEELREHVRRNDIEFRNDVSRHVLEQAIAFLDDLAPSPTVLSGLESQLEAVRRELLVAMTAAATAEQRASDAEAKVAELDGKLAKRRGAKEPVGQ